MNEINQLKKLMEAVDEPYQNYKPEEANDQYDKKTGEWSRSGEYDEPAAPKEEVTEGRLPYDIEFDNEDITIFTLGGEPVLEMPLDDWIALVSKFNREMGKPRI